MKVSVQLVIECDGDVARTSTIACIDRAQLSPADLGLHLAEARSLLRNLQGEVIDAQISELERAARLCPECGALRRRNGRHKLVYRTVFGRLALDMAIPSTMQALVFDGAAGTRYKCAPAGDQPRKYRPPSTTRVWPVTNFEESLTRCSRVPHMSAGTIISAMSCEDLARSAATSMLPPMICE